MSHRSRRRLDRVPLEERLRVVLGLLSGELSVSEAARRNGVSNQRVANWRNRFLEAGKAGLENTLPGPSTNGTSTQRRLRSENDQLKLALAEATVQSRGGSARTSLTPPDRYIAIATEAWTVWTTAER